MQPFGRWLCLSSLVLSVALLVVATGNLYAYEHRHASQVAEILLLLLLTLGTTARQPAACATVFAIATCLVTQIGSDLRRMTRATTIPACISPTEAATTLLNSGDLILFRSNSSLSRCIQFFCHSPWSHVAMIVVQDAQPYVLQMDHQKMVLVSWQMWRDGWLQQDEPMVAWRGLRGGEQQLGVFRVDSLPKDVVYPTVLQHCLQKGMCAATGTEPRYLHCGQLVVKVLAGCMGVLHTTDYGLNPGDFSVTSGRFDQLVSSRYRYLPERLLPVV